MAQELERLLTPEEVAQLLSVTVSCVNHWRWAGTGPVHVRVGRPPRYTCAAVLNYIKERTAHEGMKHPRTHEVEVSKDDPDKEDGTADGLAER
jgi:predicted DNA-binding transcriptional regulator AlpA